METSRRHCVVLKYKNGMKRGNKWIYSLTSPKIDILYPFLRMKTRKEMGKVLFLVWTLGWSKIHKCRVFYASSLCRKIITFWYWDSSRRTYSNFVWNTKMNYCILVFSWFESYDGSTNYKKRNIIHMLGQGKF